MLPLVRALLLYFAKENESWRKILWAKTMWFEINNCKGTSVRIVFVFLLFHASSSLVNVCVIVEQISNCVKKELQNLSLLTISPLQCVYV